MLTAAEIEKINMWQLERQDRFRKVPESGIYVQCLGKEFIVYKTVFQPIDDSIDLISKLAINPGESVLDIGTGCGVIAIFSAYAGAKKVVAVDINPEAVRSAKDNAKLHGFSDKIDVRLSDVFEAIRKDEKFDVVTANLPFRNKEAKDFVEATMWDTNLNAHKKFFSGVGRHLKEGGRIYFCQSNFGAAEETKRMAIKVGFSVELIGEKKMPGGDPKVFYTFLLKRK